ncbi:hypothetical protein I3842_06G062400 [Carya illinoinensis]|uniref:Uncharacterized protein n=1 Tax=Carya illinoinensis TaxID=32201 RepID=A0A922EQ72_CARIL|nr:hypothetical protein I3842_06G062400 [Carya illinoinensis]KAG6708091.1 hypothetical protein I3842_06G062400 [Carya illinoinensis]
MPIVTTSFDFSHSPAVSFFTLSFSLLPLHSHAISVFTQILSLAVLSLPSPQRASLLSRCRRRLPLFMLISFRPSLYLCPLFAQLHLILSITALSRVHCFRPIPVAEKLPRQISFVKRR